MIKRFFLAVLFVLLVQAIACAQTGDVRLSWDHDGVNTTGFEIIRCGVAGCPSTDGVLVDVPGADSRTVTLTAIPSGTHFFRARAYNIGDPDTLKVYSDWSNEVSGTIPTRPGAPVNLRIPFAGVR